MFGSFCVVTSIVGFAMLVPASGAGAQTIPSGAAVRWSDGATVVKARVHESAPGGKLIVQLPDGAVMSMDPRTTPMEYRTSGRTKWGNAGIGFGVGAGIGAMVGLLSGDDECGSGSFGCVLAFTAGQKAVSAGIGFGLLGAAIGALAIPAGKWVQVSPGSVRVSFAF